MGTIDFSAFGDPRQARTNVLISIFLGLLALGLFYFKEPKLGASVAGMIFILWRQSGRGVPLSELEEETPPQAGRTTAAAPAEGAASTVDRPALGMGPPVGVVLCCLLFALSGCGASFYVKKQRVAGGLQEESVKRQAEETDRVIKLDWFLCNSWSDRATRGAQAVLNARLEVAKGTPGAEDKQSQAETWADKLLKVMTQHCELANDTSLLLRGIPLDNLPALPAPVPPASPAPPGPQPVAPGPSAPTAPPGATPPSPPTPPEPPPSPTTLPQPPGGP